MNRDGTESKNLIPGLQWDRDVLGSDQQESQGLHGVRRVGSGCTEIWVFARSGHSDVLTMMLLPFAV